MEIRNVDVGYAGILWEGRIYIQISKKYCEGGLVTETKFQLFFSEKADNNKGIEYWILTSEGERILSNSPIEKSTF